MKNHLSLTFKISVIGVLLLGSSQVCFSVKPEDVLADGQEGREFVNPETGVPVTVRKATIKTLIENTNRFNMLVKSPDSPIKSQEIYEITQVLTSIIEPAGAAGIFTLFEPAEWLNNPTQEGRILAVCLYLRAYPHHLSSALEGRLTSLRSHVSKELAQEINHCLERHSLNIEAAKKIAEKAVLAKTPEKLLTDGQNGSDEIDPLTGKPTFVRKGTIAATRMNVQELNQLLLSTLTDETSKKIQILIKTMKDLLTPLRIVGMFDLFTPQEWLQNDEQPGRALVAVLLLQQHPQFLLPEVKGRLDSLKQKGPLILRQEIEKLSQKA